MSLRLCSESVLTINQSNHAKDIVASGQAQDQDEKGQYGEYDADSNDGMDLRSIDVGCHVEVLSASKASAFSLGGEV